MNSGEIRIRSEFSSRANELKGRFEVRRVDDPLVCGLKLIQIHRILSMNFREIRISNKFNSGVNELKGRRKR